MQPSHWDAARLQELSEALRRHMLPHLPFPELASLSGICSGWHHVVSTTPVPQLSAGCLKGLLPPDFASSKSFGEVLQQRGSAMARVRGHAPMADPQLLSFQGYAILQVAWSPQRELGSRDQRLLVKQWRLNRAARRDQLDGGMVYVNVVNVSMPRQPEALQPLHTHADTAQTRGDDSPDHAHVHSATFRDQAPSAAWSADGLHVVVVSPPLPVRLVDIPLGQTIVLGYGDETFSRTLVVNNVLSRTDVPACRPLSLVDHSMGFISPCGHVMLWGELPLGADRDSCQEEVVAYSLPELQRLYTVELPPGTLNANYQGGQKCVQKIAWAPTGGLFAIRWAFGDARPRVSNWGGVVHTSWGFVNLHGISIHQVADGECLGSHEVVDPQQDFTSPTLLASLTPQTRWDPSGSYLIWTTEKDGGCCRIDTTADTGFAWVSTQQLRGFQPRERAYPAGFPAGLPKLSLQTSLEWQGTADGHYLCVIDNHCEYSRKHSLVLAGQVSILESSGGSVLHRLGLLDAIGRVTWSQQRYTCLLEQHGVVIAPASNSASVMMSPADVAESSPCAVWRNRTLADRHVGTGLDTASSNAGSGALQHRLSPCGTIVVGIEHVTDTSSTLPVQIWHVGPDDIKQQVLCQRDADAEVLLMNAEICSLAWHPLQQACIFAVSDVEGGVHIIDAKACLEVRAWTKADLRAGQPMNALPAESQELYQSFDKTSDVLAWSPDGHRLAAFSDNACAMLNF